MILGASRNTSSFFMSTKASDTQIGGNHYLKYSYSVGDYATDVGLSAWLFNTVKYLCRLGVAKDKNNEGLDKAIHCMDLHVEYIFKTPNRTNNFRADSEECLKRFISQCEPNIQDIITLVYELNKHTFSIDTQGLELPDLYTANLRNFIYLKISALKKGNK